MLLSISVRNFAIIDSLNLEFGPGFNVLTGETGAGKSIIMQALNIILGGRAGSELVRSGSDKASVDAAFDLSRSPELVLVLGEMGFDCAEDTLLLSREISSAGKSLCRVNGRLSTVSQLKELGDWLVDLHGQHEHQSLLSVGKHLDILDGWGGKEVDGARRKVATLHGELAELDAEIAALETDARERAHLLDLYKFQVQEIDSHKLVQGEDEELEIEFQRISNSQRLKDAATGASEALGGDQGACGAVSAAVRLLEDAAQYDPALQQILDVVRSAGYELQEAERDLVRYQDDVEFDPERLEQINVRLDSIRNLKRKYGDTIGEILEYEKQTRRRAELLLNSEERNADIRKRRDSLDQELGAAARQLSSLRKAAGLQFEQAVLQELKSIAMEKTRFCVQIEETQLSARGTDKVEFLFAANAGEPIRPLAKVASGGEISRVMLAIKSAMALQDALPTMVFDEIDVGVGGRTATVIADKLVGLSRSAQVLCITHLAQIASRGDQHYRIEKSETNGRTSVHVEALAADDRVPEIARMISGAEVSATVLQSAREMLGQA